MSNLKEIFVKTELCTGCNTCKIACAVEHSQSKNLFAAINETPRPKSRVYVEYLPGNTKIPILCRHCEEAPCVNACISGAITRTDLNTVVTDNDKCIGCWTCVMVCPYGVIGRDKAQAKAYRCDRCPDLETPACVSSCPTNALVYETVESFSKHKRKTASKELVTGKGA
ncbi:MAG: 4Fe-4S dicluster domain-containing protein [Pseudomonadota bacterium]